MNDAELVRASRTDPAAFELLFVSEGPGIRNWLVREVADIDIANDLLAETFAQAWRGRLKFRGSEESSGVAWLFGIARNLVSSHRRRGRVETRGRLALGMRVDLIEVDHADEAAERLTAAMSPEKLAAELARLPEQQRLAVSGRVVRELEYQSLAMELGCTETNARALVSRGLRQLKSNLTTEGLND